MIQIPRDVLGWVTDHCRKMLPDEACGYLVGPTGDPGDYCRYVAMENVAEFRRVRYEMDPAAQLDVWNRLEGEGLRPWAVYHSHVTTGCIPSVTDIRGATDKSLLHLIVSFAYTGGPAVRLWQIDQDVRHDEDRVKVVRYRVIDHDQATPKRIMAPDLTGDVSGT